MTKIHEIHGVSWWHVIVRLERGGYTHAQVAAAIGVGRSTVQDWKNLDSEPRHFHGERLIALWRVVTGLPIDELPLRPEAVLSAKMFKDARMV